MVYPAELKNSRTQAKKVRIALNLAPGLKSTLCMGELAIKPHA